VERLTTPQEAFGYKLGAALTMERTVLKILDSSIDEAQDEQVADLLREHRQESEEHVRHVELAFRALGWEVDDAPCPAIEGLRAEGNANARKTDDSLVDSILLQGAVEVEHHEIGVYENLILGARTMGRDDVVEILDRNLRSERDALESATRTQERVASVTPQHPPEPDSIMNRLGSAVSG
jgi:ferritin-like metal-binding protein YciE